MGLGFLCALGLLTYSMKSAESEILSDSLTILVFIRLYKNIKEHNMGQCGWDCYLSFLENLKQSYGP